LMFALVTPFLVMASRTVLLQVDHFVRQLIFGAMPFLKGAVGLLWLHEAWSDIPAEERRLTDGNSVTPLGAVGRVFIPLYGFYWTFVTNTSLCAAIDRILLSRGRGRATDASLAQVAAAGQIGLVMSAAIPPLAAVGAALVVSGFWFFYMYQTDTARGFVEDALRNAPPLPTAGLL
jgi:hypothetical protein